MISWNEVLECFAESDYEVLQTVDEKQEYWRQGTLYKNMTADDKDILYFAYSDYISEMAFENQVSVIILENGRNGRHIPIGAGNVLYVKEPVSEPRGIIRLNEKFQNQFKIGQVLSFLQEAVVKDAGIQTIIEIISEFFEEPVSLLDTTFCFLAKSQSHKPGKRYSIYPDIHEKDKFDQTALKILKDGGVLEKLIHSADPFQYRFGKEIVYFIPIYVSNVKISYLTFYSNEPERWVMDKYQNYLPLLSNIMSIELAKNNFYLFNKGNYYNYIFSMLLSGENIEFEDIRMRLKLYDYDLRENIYLIEIETGMYKEFGLHKDRLADFIKNTFRNSFYIFKEGRLYFLISREEYDLITSQEITEWERTLESQKIIAAMTGPFRSFEKMAQHLKELELVLHVQKATGKQWGLYTFDQYQIKAMLFSLDCADMEIFMYKPVLELAGYDHDHGTDLVHTLQEYLKSPKDIQSVCRSLSIHRNTLYKRLDRIESVMQCDYQDGKNIMKIELTLEMLEIRYIKSAGQVYEDGKSTSCR